MRRASLTLMTTLLLATFGAIDTAAQGCPGCGWAAGSDYNRLYDVGTVETVTGEVLTIDRFSPGPGMASGVHLLLKMESDERVSIHLGPAWYVDNQSEAIEVGDAIEVMGSRVTYGGNPTLIAATVKKGDSVLALRDGQGYPVWSGWRSDGACRAGTGNCACGHNCGHHGSGHCARTGTRMR